MGTTIQIVAPARAASLISLWHLLSLDAPTVAGLWVWFIARTNHIHLPFAVPAATAIAVWMLYVVDRLLDTRGLPKQRCEPDELEARHLFHHRHRYIFLAGLMLAAVALAALMPVLDPAEMRLDVIEEGFLFAWFVILHARLSAHQLPKEIAVGLFFSAATFIPAVAREPVLRAALLPDAVLFAALCSLNCLFIYAWEHEGHAVAFVRPPHSTTRLAVGHLRALVIVFIASGLLIAVFGSLHAKLIAVACSLAAGMLFVLHCKRRLLSRNDLRAAADVALLSPILLLPFLR